MSFVVFQLLEWALLDTTYIEEIYKNCKVVGLDRSLNTE